VADSGAAVRADDDELRLAVLDMAQDDGLRAPTLNDRHKAA